MSNGEPIVVRAAVKPVATLRKPLDSVDLATGQPGRAHIERSDVAILPRAAVVGEAMVALVRRGRSCWPRSVATRWATCWPRSGGAGHARAVRGAAAVSAVTDPVSSLPDDAAAEATPVPGADA